MTKALQDKTVVVLGASAEGGCGWRCAERFAEEGARVVVGARSMDGINKLAKLTGGRAVRCDATKEADIAALAAAAREWGGGIDVAVNAAGVPVVASIDNFDPAALEMATGVNYFGNLYFIRHMARAMNDGGSITVMASIAAQRVAPGNVLYAAAKAATVCAVQYAALEYAPRRIRTNVIVPGYIDTPQMGPLTANKQFVEMFFKEIPLKRAVDAREIANTAYWLATTPSVTGISVLIDNGLALRRLPMPEEMANTLEANLPPPR